MVNSSYKNTVSGGADLKKAVSNVVLSFFGTLLILCLSSASRGDVLMFLVITWKYCSGDHEYILPQEGGIELAKAGDNLGTFKDAYFYLIVSTIISFGFLFGLGGFLKWYFYICQSDHPETWKCQPTKFLTSKDELREIKLACLNLTIGSCLSGLYTTYIMNGGKLSQMKFSMEETGYFYFVVSTICLFVFQDASLYYAHRLMHTPWLYKHIHKIHHSFHSPTAFSAAAFHPVEFIIFQFLLVLPLFVVPIHFISFIGCALYIYYYGVLDHSGIDMDSIWPWQPPVRFHDDHHKYFHVNFGFNLTIFDRFHDTIRRNNRAYGEHIFGGRGKTKY